MDQKSNNQEKVAVVGAHEPSSWRDVSAVETGAWDAKATKQLLWKLDRNIVPILSLVCLFCFLDRTNIGNARLDNLESDLRLRGLQYNDCLAILYPFYMWVAPQSCVLCPETDT